MKKAFLLFCLIFAVASTSRAQVDSVYYGNSPQPKKPREKEKPSFDLKDKLSFGGNFMLWFGTTTYVYLSPVVNCALNKRINVGLGLIYNYYGYNSGASKFSYSIYGLHSYALGFLTKNVFAKVEFNHLLQPNVYSYNLNDKVWVSYVYVGGGFRQPLGDRAAFYTSIMYNVNQNAQSIFYANPMIQVGILAGF
jgi:hypothetical protein